MRFISSLVFIVFVFPVLAEDLYTKDAVKKTQELLKDRQKRNAAIKNSPKGKEADAKAGALAGSEKNKDEMYDISSGVLEKLVEETNGDDKKMQEILKEAEKNPEAFYEKMFSAEEKARLQKLSKDIEQKQGGKPTRP